MTWDSYILYSIVLGRVSLFSFVGPNSGLVTLVTLVHTDFCDCPMIQLMLRQGRRGSLCCFLSQSRHDYLVQSSSCPWEMR